MILKKTAIYKESIKENIIDLIFAIILSLKSFISYNIAKKFDHDFDYLSIFLQ